MYGQLGDGSLSNRTVPTPVSGLSSNVAAIAPGWLHTCALTDSGTAKCWGHNTYGQLGDGTTSDHVTPAAVTGFTTGIGQIFGAAYLSPDTLPAGEHSLVAEYVGDAGHTSSLSAAITHVVDKGGTEVIKIKVKPKKPKAGNTARVEVVLAAVAPANGNPDGKVSVKDGKTKLGSFKLK